MNKKLWFALAIGLQVLLLLGMVGRHTFTLQTGVPIMLKTAPVDPWDYFRGEYVTLNYEISTLNPKLMEMEGTPYKSGQALWVTLQPGDPFHKPVRVSPNRPTELAAGMVALQGRVEWVNDWDGGPERPIGSVQIRYGIEQFYVPEGQGKNLETRLEQMSVRAMVDRFGRAALSKVYLDGKEIRWQ
jgi:uncharacterized membrane-anchored protein